VRWVASDLDGTLVRPDGTVSARTVAALDACERAGVTVAFVTGRPVRWLAPIVAATGHHGVAICANGAVVYDLEHERVLATRAMERDAARMIVAALRGALPGGAFSVEALGGFRREPGFRTRYDDDAFAPAPVDELLAGGDAILKILYRLEGATADDMLAAARPALAGLGEPVHSNSADCLLEIAAPGVSKAATLADLVAAAGFAPRDVVAFGDMPNDVPMLRWAGVGYAMADGHAEAIAAADEVAPPCVEDGVARVLEGLLAAVAR
jgi:Cof subfamily protein (haloacid dehalogenase superfamily)